MKKSKKTNKQLEKEIEKLVIKRYGEGSQFLLMAAECNSAYTNFLSSSPSFFLVYGSILLGQLPHPKGSGLCGASPCGTRLKHIRLVDNSLPSKQVSSRVGEF